MPMSNTRPFSMPPNPPVMNRPLRIALCAGEASGDLLGADLIGALKLRWPDAQIEGIGGPRMRGAGMTTWFDASELSVMGLVEVLRHLPRLLRRRRELRARALAWTPDVFIGIDAPDFNLGTERWLKTRGIRTVHFVSPSVWAWRAGRAAKIGRSADRVLCLFPMEPPIYAAHGVDARFVGHPLADAMSLHPDRDAARDALGLPRDATVLAVLPGSRLGEIERLAPMFLDAASRVATSVPGLHVVIPAANDECAAALRALMDRAPIERGVEMRPRLIDGCAREAMIASDVVLLASGTATLEAMLAKRPMVVGYTVAPLTYAIVKRLGMLKVEHYALPNILAGRELVPELMQDECTADNLASAVLRWLNDPVAVAALLPAFDAIHVQLRHDASTRAVDAIAGLIEGTDGDV